MQHNQELAAKQVRIAHSAEILTPAAQASTNSFVDVADGLIDTLYRSSLAIIMKNTHGSNGLSWKILGSIDGSVFVEVVSSANIAFGAVGTAYTVSNPPFRYYKTQIKSQTNDQAAEGTLHMLAK